MINFFKKLLGINTGSGCPSTPKETVAEILTPPETKIVSTGSIIEPIKEVSTYIEPAKPVNKVRANTVPATLANTKPKARPAVKEGNTKGGNNVVKIQPKQTNKPKAPSKPKRK